MYEITDRDWSKSPASSIEAGSYNSSTNIISNYTYGTGYSNSGDNPYIHALYVNRNVDNQMRAWQYNGANENNHGGNKEWYIDREHIWPKSQGFDNSGEGGARGDPMHLWPGDSDVNSSIHNNNFYGYVDIENATSHGKWNYATANYLGPSVTLNNGTNVFEPQDSDKGDIARAIFYMVARYNYLSGEDDGIDTNNPNLTLVQDNTVLSSYTSSTSNAGKMGILTDLLAWHHADPVDEFEIHRNNLLFTNYTNNRNPFIDFPEWVDFIWGTANYNGKTLQSYSSSPTGYAKPNSDTINGYNSSTPQEITSIVATASKTFNVGDTITKADINVVDNNGNDITDYTFSNNGYMFTYNDAPSGGSLGSKSFQISYGNLSCTLTTNVSRKAHEDVPNVSTYISSAEFLDSSISTSYKTESPSNVELCGINFTISTNAYLYYTTSNSNKIYHLSYGKKAGSIQNTEPFATSLTSVEVKQMDGSRSDGVLSVSQNGITWTTYSNANLETGSYHYFKFEYTNSSTSYSNIDSISFSIKGNDNPSNVSNYIMFEDTNNQCTNKFGFAISLFESMNVTGRLTFMTSNDFVISTARERLEAWTAHLGKQITYSNNDYIVTDAQNYLLFDTVRRPSFHAVHRARRR